MIYYCFSLFIECMSNDELSGWFKVFLVLRPDQFNYLVLGFF